MVICLHYFQPPRLRLPSLALVRMIISSSGLMAPKVYICTWRISQSFFPSKVCSHVVIPSINYFSTKNDDGTSAEGETHPVMKNLSNVKSEQLLEEDNQDSISNSESIVSEEEKHLQPALSGLAHDRTLPGSALKTVAVVPGKGPPPEPPVTCCMSGCANCVWIAYAEELKNYYSDGGERSREALEKIEDPSLRAFVKLELGL